MNWDGTLLIATLNSLEVLLCRAHSFGRNRRGVGLLMGRYRRSTGRRSLRQRALCDADGCLIADLYVCGSAFIGAEDRNRRFARGLSDHQEHLRRRHQHSGRSCSSPRYRWRFGTAVSRLVIAPAIIPFFMAGFRLAVGRGIVGLVVGEFFTAQTGLGGLVVRYASNFKTAEMFVPIVVLVAIGYGLTSLVACCKSVDALEGD